MNDANAAVRAASAPPTVIEVRGLEKVFRTWRWARVGGVPLPFARPIRVDAVAGIDFAVQEGEIFGFLGPNGAGKTTTIKMLMGLIRPSAGTMSVFGGSPDELSTKARIGYLPEQPYFYDYLKPAEILDFYARIFRIPRAERRRRIDALLELVGLTDARDKRLRQFSKGMLQRVGIASALINDPELVVLDEPLSGLDPIGRKEMRDIIVSVRERGKTVFFSSHILSDIEMICDKVAIINRGRLQATGALTDLLDAKRMNTEIVVRELTDPARVIAAAADVRLEPVGAYHRVYCEEADSRAVLSAVLAAGATVETVTRKRESLEDLFMREALRGRPARPAGANTSATAAPAAE